MHIPRHVVDDYEKRKMVPQPSNIKPADMVMARQTIAFWDFPKPLVMAVNGLAVGGGANIALANYADIVICSSAARFKYPFSTLGLTPELGSSSLIPFVVGMAKAKEIMMLGVRMTRNNSQAATELYLLKLHVYEVYTGCSCHWHLQDWFSAEDAVQLGLANQVVAPEELMPRAVVRTPRAPPTVIA